VWENIRGPKPFQFREPFGRVGAHGLEQDSSGDFPNADGITRKTEFLGKADRLTAAVLEKLCDLRFRHGISIYQ